MAWVDSLSGYWNFLDFPKRKIFVSYHHKNDQAYYTRFIETFTSYYEILWDNSLDRLLDTDNPDYVIRRIREGYITGSSCTFVLCGAETPWRKFVDWEIKATLDATHGLVGILLPTISWNVSNQRIIPDRLYDNWLTRYAILVDWINIIDQPWHLVNLIEKARNRPGYLINNRRPLRRANRNALPTVPRSAHPATASARGMASYLTGPPEPLLEHLRAIMGMHLFG